MQPWLTKALWRAGAKLSVGLAVVGALVGIRIVTATPVGVDADLAELARLEAQLEAERRSGVPAFEAGEPPSGGSTTATSSGTDAGRAPAPAADGDLDRVVRCRGGQDVQFMRAADCSMRGGRLEELPPPAADDASSSPGR